jgi:NAD(P)-dependent dehydrogenase (short-subunit alcohol dehydrogenase family)
VVEFLKGGKMTLSIKDKVALVTGGSRGIGLAIAGAFLAAGGKVAICDNNQDQLKDTARILKLATVVEYRELLQMSQWKTKSEAW